MMALPHPRFVLFFGVLLGSTAAALPLIPLERAFIVGFDLATIAFLASVVPLWRKGTPSRMRENAARDDGGRTLLLGISGVVSVVILIGLGLIVVGRSRLGPGDLGLVVVTLVLAWSFVNTVYTLHYAHIYYEKTPSGGDHVGLRFPDTELPEFSDFAYFSFVIGMTFQVSDVAITAPRLRKVVTVHAVLAFFFNLGVLALTINVLAGVL